MNIAVKLLPANFGRMLHQVKVQDKILTYKKTGKGLKPLLLFHGFGQNHQAFDSLIESLAETYTLYSFDIFFHGESHWPGEQTLEKETWALFMNQLFQENQIERFSLLGFSMGAKFSLATVELFPERVDRLVLIAPDGIRINFWYRLATDTALVRRFFKGMILKPRRLLRLTKFSRSLKLVDNGLLVTAEYQMNTQQRRERVYYSWVVFRKLKFRMKKIAQLIEQYNIKPLVIVGRFDKIIPPKRMRPLMHQLPAHVFHLIQSGHNQLIENSKSLVVSFLNEKKN